MIEEMVLKSSRLVYKGLQPKLNPEKDKEYKELLGLCLSSHEFTDTVIAIAEGMSLSVVDISERGIILTPEDTDSRFAMGISDYRKELEGDVDTQGADAKAKRSLIALVQVAIAATFFPTADDLDDDDYDALGKSATAHDINTVLMRICQNIVSETDADILSDSLKKGAGMIIALPESLPTGKLPTLKSRFGAITIVAQHLDRSGMIKFHKTSDNEGYFPTYRYQQLLRRRAIGRLFDLCHEYASTPETESPNP